MDDTSKLAASLLMLASWEPDRELHEARAAINGSVFKPTLPSPPRNLAELESALADARAALDRVEARLRAEVRA